MQLLISFLFELQMNKVMDPQKLAGTMREFEMANAKMNMTEETSEYRG